jgi:hypothetical protein
MKLIDLFPSPQIVAHLKSNDLPGATAELLKRLAAIYTGLRGEDVAELDYLLHHETPEQELRPVNGVLVLSVHFPRFHHLVGVFGRSPNGFRTPGAGRQKVNALCLLVIPEDRKDLEDRAVASVRTLMEERSFPSRLRACRDEEDLCRLLDEEDQKAGHGQHAG